MPSRFLHFVDAPTTLQEVLKQNQGCKMLYLQYLQRLIIEVEQDGAALDDALRKLVKVDLL